MFISDGHVAKIGHAVHIRCAKRRKSDLIAEIADLLGVRGHYAPPSRAYVITSRQIHGELGRLSAGALDKRLPTYVWQLSQRQARLLLEALGATSALYTASSAGLADDVQRLALHAGWSANIAVGREADGVEAHRTPNGTMRTFRSNADALHVTVLKSRNKPTVNRPFAERQDGQKEGLVGYQGAVHCLTVPGGVFYVRRHKKPVWTGNSIVAQLLPQSDMPYIAASGITPDLIINMHSFPSRMTIGQLYETSLAKTCARKCAIADGTAFLPISYDDIGAELQRLGFRYNGRERMYDSRGRHQDVALFIGFTYEQRLLKFVLDDEYAVAGTGPTDATTGQPLGGKNVGGGLRLGEMENWGLLSHGSTMTQLEKLTEDSDGRTAYVCRGCGDTAICNPHDEVYRCLNCGEYADIAAVETRKSAIVFREELDASNVKMRLGLRPREFEKRLPPGPSS
jgi:hypothetical protein